MSGVVGRMLGVLAGVMLVAGGCAGPEAGEVPTGAVLLDELQVDTLAQEHSSGVEERARVVIRSHEELTAFWDRVYQTRQPQPEPPEVDFDVRMVVAVSMGARPTGGYVINVEEVYESEEGLHVVVHETSPGTSCMVTQAVTQPVVLVSVPRTEAEVTFREHESVREC